ncbi:MAG: hypothetical protein ACOH2R_08630 [Pseudomonas sp.]
MAGFRSDANAIVAVVSGVDQLTIKNTGVATAAAAAVSGKDLTTFDQSFGLGQTWQNLTASRALGTTYTNTTGKSIVLFVSANTNAFSNLRFTVNGNLFYGSDQSSGYNNSLMIVVPPGGTYTAAMGAGTQVLSYWWELR